MIASIFGQSGEDDAYFGHAAPILLFPALRLLFFKSKYIRYRPITKWVYRFHISSFLIFIAFCRIAFERVSGMSLYRITRKDSKYIYKMRNQRRRNA